MHVVAGKYVIVSVRRENEVNWLCLLFGIMYSHKVLIVVSVQKNQQKKSRNALVAMSNWSSGR